MGSVTVERVTGGPGLQQKLDECFAIDDASATLNVKARTFYTELAHSAASRNYFSLFLLRLSGRPIAFQYGLTYGGIFYVPKFGYDAAFEACSPGLILLEEIMKDCIDRQLKGYDFLGMDLPWKSDWSTKVCTHNWLVIYRDAIFEHALQEGKFDWHGKAS